METMKANLLVNIPIMLLSLTCIFPVVAAVFVLKRM